MNPLGTAAQIDTASGATLNNDFNTIPVNDIDNVVASNSVAPTKIGSGVNHSAQQIMNTDGSYMIIGLNSDTNQLGLFFYDSSGNLIASYLGATDFKYSDDGHNYYQNGQLPDKTFGAAFAPTGTNVEDYFS